MGVDWKMDLGENREGGEYDQKTILKCLIKHLKFISKISCKSNLEEIKILASLNCGFLIESS